jgi:hypothetical protein
MQAGGRENRPGSRPGSAGTGGAPPAVVRRAKDGGAVIPSRSAMQMLPSEGLPLAIGSALLDAKVLPRRTFALGHGKIQKKSRPLLPPPALLSIPKIQRYPALLALNERGEIAKVEREVRSSASNAPCGGVGVMPWP